MPSTPSHQAHAKRIDRIMAFTISSGGLLIIGAVLAMLLFILKESLPLFMPAQSRSVGTLQAPRSGGAWLDESGKTVVLLSQSLGLKALRFPEGTPLPVPAEGPTLPWRTFTPLSARGEALVIGFGGAQGQGRAGREGADRGQGAEVPGSGLGLATEVQGVGLPRLRGEDQGLAPHEEARPQGRGPLGQAEGEALRLHGRKGDAAGL